LKSTIPSCIIARLIMLAKNNDFVNSKTT
jgi:hypothetical protein